MIIIEGSICISTYRDADVVTNPQEPHGKDMDTTVVVKCRKVRYERHGK
jgi:hypothetical protein